MLLDVMVHERKFLGLSAPPISVFPLLFSLLDPALDYLPSFRHLVVDHARAQIRVNLSEASALLNTLTDPNVRVGHNGEPLLVLPGEVGDVAHGDGQDGPGGADADGEREGGAEEDVAVAGDNATGHRGDEDVDGTGHELLAAGPRGRERGNCVGEGLLEVERRVDRVVDLVLGGDGVLVEG